jgi:predicted ribosomally synthesized peptide with SipW-like signal peptide
MSKKISILFLGMALLLVVGAMQAGGTRSYFSDTETATVTIQAGVWDVPHASPSLSLDPDDAETETCGNQVYHVINVSNTGDEPKDLARGVTLNVSIVKGEQYVAVDGLVYNPVIGDIPAGEAREFSLGIYLNDLWGRLKMEKRSS